jgi:hypothetical protein
MMRRYFNILYLVVFIFILVGHGGFAQRLNISNDPEKFLETVNQIMTGANTELATAADAQFATAWNSGKLNSAHQEKIIAISGNMLKKNYGSREYFVPFFSMISFASDKLSPDVMTNMLNGMEKAVDQYDGKAFRTILSTLRSYFEKSMLYNSNFNRLYVEGAKIDFEFKGLQAGPAFETPGSEDPLTDAFSDWDNNTTNGWNDWGTNESTGNNNQGNNSTGWDTWESPTTWEEPEPQPAFKSVAEALAQKTPQPQVEGFVMNIEHADFIFVTSFDSALLRNTSGGLMLHKELFVGNGGKFDWGTAGLDPDQVYCEFSEYNFNISKTELKAAQVKLTYKGKIDKPVEGIFEYDSKRRNGKPQYPRFKSYYNDISVKDIAGEGFVYTGGFSMRGPDIVGASILPGESTMEMYHKTRRVFYAKADNVVFGDTAVDATVSSISIYHQKDSIYHPAIRFRYYPGDKVLVVRKSDGNFRHMPFVSSYYNMEIQAEMIQWFLDKDSLDISNLTARTQIPAVFESREYFSEARFTRLTGLLGFNPLLMSFSYARKKNADSFYYLDMANELKQNPNHVRQGMLELWQRGYADFDPATGKVTMKEKATHYILSNYKRKDYDDLLIPSMTSAHPNATLNLETQEMTVRGIERFFISKSQNVFIQPEESSIKLLKNRDFKFDGTLFAGNFEFVGKDFTFRYDSFLVDLQQIDSIRFYVDVKDERTNRITRKQIDNKLVSLDSRNEAMAGVMSDIGETRGTLYINKPNNKSGLQEFPHYPVFNANRGAVVYFDNKKILDQAYDHSVFFAIPPFEIDSLGSTDPASIGFKGWFISGGILPEFEETLHIMADNSMGFVHVVPQEGYKLYGGTGVVYDTISLTSKGINSSGKINYLTGTLESERFVFYTDSVLAIGTSAVIQPGNLGPASFPQVSLDQFKMKWLPYQDSLYITNLDKPFQFYNNTASLYGTSIMNSNGLYGSGQLFTRGSEAVSKGFAFREHDYQARHANFEIKSNNPNKPALAGIDVRLNFDLLNNTAGISPEIEGVAAIEFPFAQYRTSISKAEWNLDEQKVFMTKPADVDLSSSYFYTTRKELDSLAFNATAAEYDLNSLELFISGIPYIKVADAKITPENNSVLILENARLGRLHNTTVVIDTLNEYHTLIDGTIDILSRNKFEGQATYQYINHSLDTFKIEFRKFDLAEVPGRRRDEIIRYTVSGGTVDEKENLVISPGMVYKGQATMYANKLPLELDGYVKLDFKRLEDNNTWIKYFSDNPEQQDIKFDFKTSVTDKGEPLTAGLHYHGRSNSLYATFVTERLTPGDIDFFIPDGILSYNAEDKKYQIVDPLKVDGKNFSGKIFTFSEETGEITFEGPLKFIDDTEEVNLEASGIGRGNMYEEEFSVDAFLSFNFNLPPQSLTTMSVDLFDVVDRLGPAEAHADITNLLYKASEIIGESSAKEYDKRSRGNYVPLLSISPRLNRSLVISTANLVWSAKDKAWYSTGKIGVSNILRQDINAMLDGFVEIRKTENHGEIVNIFIQASPVVWYHFSFMENRLVVSSSNDEMNEIIASRTNIDRARLGEFVFVQGDIAEALSYVNRFRKQYLGIEEPYQMRLSAQPPTQTQPFTQPADVLPQSVEEREITNEDQGF